MTESVRLQKFLSECGVASRRASETLIQEGKVKVNGNIVTELGTKVVPGKDQVRVRNKIIIPARKGVILLHKPKGVVSSLSDPEGRRCLADFITKPYRSYFPVGRLDWDSTGLIVLTNDGELAERLMHPRYGFERKYHVRVEGHPTDKTLRRIERGVNLPDGIVTANVRVLEKDDKSMWLEIIITEGRNRVIRRLMEHLRHHVIKLQRISHGPFELGRIKAGGMRHLTEREYLRAKSRVMRG